MFLLYEIDVLICRSKMRVSFSFNLNLARILFCSERFSMKAEVTKTIVFDILSIYHDLSCLSSKQIYF